MRPSPHFRQLVTGLLLAALCCLAATAAAEEGPALSLEAAIGIALEANLGIKQAEEDLNAAQYVRKQSITGFLPTFKSSYSYLHRNKPQSQKLITGVAPVDVIVTPEDEYSFVTSFNQPVFTGFALINQYRIADLGVNVAEFSAELKRQDVILDTKNAYFRILKAKKLVDVALQNVEQIEAQKEVSQNFYQVGMSPLNDLLQSQVRLANAKQELITSQNNLAVAESQFNTVLRRSVNEPVNVVDVLDFVSFDKDIDYCLETARDNRLEVKIADLNIELADKEVRLTERDFLPEINLQGNYIRRGEDWDVDGGESITDAAQWNIQAVATWEFWQWGRTYYGKKEKLSRLAQAKYGKASIIDQISLEVKQAHLRLREAEKNIYTVEKAIEQARENLRITEEQYKEQVATQTDVLVAQTLLTQTLTNYYNALYDFKIAKAVLIRAMGQEELQ